MGANFNEIAAGPRRRWRASRPPRSDTNDSSLTALELSIMLLRWRGPIWRATLLNDPDCVSDQRGAKLCSGSVCSLLVINGRDQELIAFGAGAGGAPRTMEAPGREGELLSLSSSCCVA